MFLINHRDNVTLTDDCFKWLHKLLLAAEPFQRVLSHCWGNSNNGVHAAYYTVPMRLLHSSHMKVRIWNSFTPRVRITKSGNGFHKLRGGRLENTGLKEVNDNGGSKLWEWLCVCVCVCEWVSETVKVVNLWKIYIEQWSWERKAFPERGDEVPSETVNVKILKLVCVLTNYPQ